MASHRRVMGWLVPWAIVLAGAAGAPAQAPRPESVKFPVHTEAPNSPPFAAVSLPLELLPPEVRDKVRRVLDGPTLSAFGPTETFTCQPGMYRWLLDHPRHGSALWRLLGAKVTELEDRGGGRYGWRDANGSDIQWETVLNTPQLRVWYAEGKARPGALLPAIHGRVVVVLRYQEGQNSRGRSTIRHQAHVLVRSDSRTLGAVARMLGGTAPRIAEHFMSQLEMFYGALSWYLDQDAQRAERLFQRIGQPVPEGTIQR